MNKDNVKLAIAPIGWTNDDMPELGSENTFQQIVSEMALAGFTGSEVGSKYPRDPAVLKPMLDIRGIQICNARFSTFFANGQREKTIDEFVNHMNFLHAMGAKVIGCSEQSGSIQGLDKPILGDAKPCFSDEEWQRVAEGYNTLGRGGGEGDAGLSASPHGHRHSDHRGNRQIYVAGGRARLPAVRHRTCTVFRRRRSADACDPQKYLPRINHVHLKDVRPPVIDRVPRRPVVPRRREKGTFTVPGDGVIDFRPVFKLLDDFGYKGWMVVEAEQDPALANPFEYAVKARKYIRETAGI